MYSSQRVPFAPLPINENSYNNNYNYQGGDAYSTNLNQGFQCNPNNSVPFQQNIGPNQFPPLQYAPIGSNVGM
jgi:hypothetical protein